MTDKICPFLKDVCSRNCQLWNSNVNACTIPLFNSNIFKLIKSQEKLESTIKDLIIAIQMEKLNDNN